jgi:hypothetical protein
MRERRRPSSRPRKDRLIQTRVPRDLEETLKHQAERRRLSVSHLIRNVLEDAFNLVDGVMDHVDVLVADSTDLGRQVRRDARDIAKKAQEVGRHSGRGESAEPGTAEPAPAEPAKLARDLSHVLAWNPVTMNRSARCSSCNEPILRGSPGHLGVSETPGLPPEWLCDACLDAL